MDLNKRNQSQTVCEVTLGTLGWGGGYHPPLFAHPVSLLLLPPFPWLEKEEGFREKEESGGLEFQRPL